MKEHFKSIGNDGKEDCWSSITHKTYNTFKNKKRRKEKQVWKKEKE